MRLLVLILLLPLSAAFAQVYRSVAEDGTVTFSDRPTPGAESVQVPPTSSYTPPALPSISSSAPPELKQTSDEADRPQSIAVQSPGADEAVRENAGNVPYSFSVSPALRPGQRIRVLLDGVPVHESATPSGALENVDRGSHVLSGELVGDDGSVIARSDSVEFHLLRVAGGGGLLR